MFTRTRRFIFFLVLAAAAAAVPLGAASPPSPRDPESPPASPPRSVSHTSRTSTTSGGLSVRIDLSSLGSIFHQKEVAGGVAVVAKNACSDRHWLALADGAACPKVRGWETSPLFGASPARSRAGFPARTFCRYESAKTPKDKAVAALLALPGLHGVVKRCGVVQAIAQDAANAAADPAKSDPPAVSIGAGSGSTGTALDEVQSSKLARDFLYEVGDTDLPLRANDAPNVRLAVLDTVATAEGVPDTLPAGCIDHGFGIAHIVRELSCGDSGCAATLATQLALPLPESGASHETAAKSPCGGYGTPGDLAAAIRAAVDGWLAKSAQPDRRSHLILNLSLGWDPKVLREQLGAVDPDDHLNSEELAVYDALAYAAERGALAITAAGNLLGGKLPEVGPILPAGWYAQPPAIPLLPPSAETVVWAVGGIARGGRRLANARPGSEPALVTYGDHAVVKLAPGRYTKPLTGTSVSAAVASSAAALVWHLRPELPGREVMALLASSGSDLGRGAELYRAAVGENAGPTAPPAVHRLDLSAALGAALAPKAAEIAQSPAIGCHLVQVPADKIPAGCPRRTYFTCDGAPPVCTADALPTRAHPGPVGPQPEANPCPACSLGGGGGSGFAALRVQIDPDWPQGCLTDAMLEVETEKGEKIGIPISAGKELCPGDRLEVGNLDLPASVAAARISFKLAKEDFSVHSPVRVAAFASR